MEQADPVLEQIGGALREISQLVLNHVHWLMSGDTRPWAEARYEARLNAEMTGIVQSLSVVHPDGKETKVRPADEIGPLLPALFSLSLKFKDPWIGFTIALTPQGDCKTGFQYP